LISPSVSLIKVILIKDAKVTGLNLKTAAGALVPGAGNGIESCALAVDPEAWRSIYLAAFVTGIKSISPYTNEGLYLQRIFFRLI
jgi:hypothetical protein